MIFLNSSQVLWQRDPLPFLLFVIVMAALSRMMEKAITCWWFLICFLSIILSYFPGFSQLVHNGIFLTAVIFNYQKNKKIILSYFMEMIQIKFGPWESNISLGKLELVPVECAECVRRVGGYSWLQSVKLTNEVSGPSIGLYFQIENNVEYHPGKDGKRSGRLKKKTLPFQGR